MMKEDFTIEGLPFEEVHGERIIERCLQKIG